FAAQATLNSSRPFGRFPWIEGTARHEFVANSRSRSKRRQNRRLVAASVGTRHFGCHWRRKRGPPLQLLVGRTRAGVAGAERESSRPATLLRPRDSRGRSPGCLPALPRNAPSVR